MDLDLFTADQIATPLFDSTDQLEVSYHDYEKVEFHYNTFEAISFIVIVMEEILRVLLRHLERERERGGRESMGVAKAVSIALLFPLFLHSTLTSSSSTINYNNNQDIQVSAAARQLQQYEPNHEVHCSRERSRAAWKIIEEYLMPFVEQEKYQISHKCRLHPSNDMFREQEQHKTQVDVNEWRCGFCQKMFHAENYLDTHFQNRHQNLLNDSLADTCFPVNEGHSTSRLHEFFLRQFCDAHSCSGRHKPFARGGRKRSSVFYLAISILTLMLLPIFYGIVYLYRREMRSGVHDLKRISQTGIGRKTKPT
ncbi:hypothetical protein AMTRI_Chr07g78670 [Amborella trichopoda]